MLLTVVDYGVGNLRSIAKSIEKANSDNNLNYSVKVSSDVNDVKKSDKIVLPGQGSFKACKEGIDKIIGLQQTLNESVLVKKKPVLAFYATGKEISNLKKIPVWKVRNSNGNYLSSLINNLPIIFKTQKILRDNDQKIFIKEINKHLKSNTNIIITSGAVSAGKFDFVPGIIKNFKLANSFKGVAIRPGKPILFSKFK